VVAEHYAREIAALYAKSEDKQPAA